jgi:sensor c-di-GMP phosphodiesterase-like protein
MKRTRKIRILVALAATILAACCGVGAGYLLGGGLALRQAKHQIQENASGLMTEEIATLSEAYATIEKMHASTYPYCSAEEIGYFRKLLFQTDYLSDAGRMHDGIIDCSSVLSQDDLPRAPLKPVVIMGSGGRVYVVTGPFQVRNKPTFAIQVGDMYVVINSNTGKPEGSPPFPFIMTVIPALHRSPVRLMSTSPQPDDALFSRAGFAWKRGTLYCTLCTSDKLSCATTFITMTDVLQSDRTLMRICMALGGMTGALFGLVLALFYRRTRSMEQQLRRAIRKDKLRVEYQQIVSLASGRIVGAEALARWTDEEGFAVGPDIFVKIAEERGFVGSITRLVVRHVLRDFAATLRACPDFRLSINVAATDLADSRFLPMLERALKRAEVPAESLIIEITESCTARHEMAIAAILRLRQKGHSVHIDDFGTGYSSLSYLHDLAVDAIKIDRSFTRTIGTEAITVAILPQILAMAGALNLQVIVEGIETSQQAVYFAALEQPILGQGWLFGRAVAPEEFHRLLAEDKKRAQAGTAGV